MGPLGFPELVIIFVVALIVFGPRKLPELGRSLGKGLSEFKRASSELRSTLDEEIRVEERKVIPPTTAEVLETPAPTDPDVLTAAAERDTVARGEHHS